jgi:hypothetical protein
MEAGSVAALRNHAQKYEIFCAQRMLDLLKLGHSTCSQVIPPDCKLFELRA